MSRVEKVSIFKIHIAVISEALASQKPLEPRAIPFIKLTPARYSTPAAKIGLHFPTFGFVGDAED